MGDRKIKQSTNNDDSIDSSIISRDGLSQTASNISSDEKETPTNAPKVDIGADLERMKQDTLRIYRKDAEVEKQNLKQQFEETIKDAKRELETKIDDSKLTIVETLGIFVALFTFVSIEFQIFRSFSSWYAGASLTLIILGALTFFVLLLTTLLNKKRIKDLWYFAAFSFICIVGGVVLLGSSTKIDSNYILKTEISKSFYTRDELLQFVNDNKTNKEWLNCLRDAGYFKLKCFQ